MSRWFETTEAIKQIESADERMTEMQEEREDERKRRIKAEARVAELEMCIAGATEAVDSALVSLTEGDLDGWEVHLIKGRLDGTTKIHSKRLSR